MSNCMKGFFLLIIKNRSTKKSYPLFSPLSSSYSSHAPPSLTHHVLNCHPEKETFPPPLRDHPRLIPLLISSALSTFTPLWVEKKKKESCTLSSELAVNFLTVAWFPSRGRAHLLKVWLVIDWLDRINYASFVCRRRFKQHTV